MAAGQASMALHTMAILQAYQADDLKESGGLTPEAVKVFRKPTDLALRATKHTARAVGCSGGLGSHRAPLMAESH